MDQPKRLWLLRIVRALCVILGLAAWFATQAALGARPHVDQITDAPLHWLSPIHDYLLTHIPARNALLISSSAIIDILAIFLLLRSILGPTIRPFLGLLILFLLRQICEMLVLLPIPTEMIWPPEGPGFPSLLVTYGVGNDLFFSGHTALAVFGAIELARLHRALIPVGIFIILYEMFTVLALRAHWTMDVYAGAVTAALIAILAGWLAPSVDRITSRLAKVKSNSQDQGARV